MACNLTFTLLCVAVFAIFFINDVSCGKKDGKKDEVVDTEKWKKKNIRDYTEADLERLYDQWEDADEDELEEDELPEWKRSGPQVDMSKIDMNDPEGMLKMTKKGKTLMIFATVSGNPTKDEAEKITQIWQGSLFNANLEIQRYMVSDNRAIFMVKDGSLAWDIKRYLLDQERCQEVTIEGKSYPGRAATGKGPEDTDDKTSTKKDNQKKDNKAEELKKKIKMKQNEGMDDKSSRNKEKMLREKQQNKLDKQQNKMDKQQNKMDKQQNKMDKQQNKMDKPKKKLDNRTDKKIEL